MAKAVITPSPEILFSSIPKSLQRCSTNISHSSNEPSSSRTQTLLLLIYAFHAVWRYGHHRPAGALAPSLSSSSTGFICLSPAYLVLAMLIASKETVPTVILFNALLACFGFAIQPPFILIELFKKGNWNSLLALISCSTNASPSERTGKRHCLIQTAQMPVRQGR